MIDESVAATTTPVVALPRSRDAALVALFRVHYTDLVRLARLLVDDVETAEDVVQDAFGALHRRWGALDDTNRALGYLRSAVLNGGRSTLRRRATVRRAGDAAPLPPADSAELLVVQDEAASAVRAALVELPRRQREVVVLRYFLDMSEAEIATALGISRGAVKAHAARALAALNARLETVR
jgi:RNA polymerase sigma-70 factor (sigma-E family)